MSNTVDTSSDDDLPDFDFRAISSTSKKVTPEKTIPGQSSQPAVRLPSSVSLDGFGLGETKHSKSSDRLPSYKYGLDSLASDKQKKEVAQKLMSKKEAAIKEEVELGGVSEWNPTTAVCSSFTINDQTGGLDYKQLQWLKPQNDEIKDEAPGEKVFSSADLLKTTPSKIMPLESCGFKVAGPVDEILKTASSSDELIQSLVLGGTIHLYFHKFSCKTAVTRWLFYLIAQHENPLIIHEAFTSLWHIVTGYQSVDDAPIFHVPVKEILTLFANYGCKVNRLFTIVGMTCHLEGEVQDLSATDDQDKIPNNKEEEILSYYENIHYVIRVLTFLFSNSPKSLSVYSTSERTVLVTFLFLISLDSHIVRDVIQLEIQTCIAAVLNSYQPVQWPQIICELGSQLPKLCSYHANYVHLVETCPTTARGIQLQRSLSFTLLQLMYKLTPQYLPEIKPNDLVKLLSQNSKQQLMCGGYYSLYSAVQLMDHCVGSERISSSDKASLQQCIKLLRLVVAADIREKVTYLDPTRVKDLIVKVTSKWQLMCQSVISKQLNMFNYVRSPLKIERVTSGQQKPSDSDDDEAMCE